MSNSTPTLCPGPRRHPGERELMVWWLLEASWPHRQWTGPSSAALAPWFWDCPLSRQPGDALETLLDSEPGTGALGLRILLP